MSELSSHGINGDDKIDEIRSNRMNNVNFISPRSNFQFRHQNGRNRRNFDINLYATKKSAAQGLLDLALLMANASQLKHIILTEGEHRFYTVMIVLLSISIILQIMVGVGLLLLVRIRIYDYYTKGEIENDGEETDSAGQQGEMETEEQRIQKKLRRADFLNNWIVAGIFILTVINVFISAFGLDESPRKQNSTG